MVAIASVVALAGCGSQATSTTSSARVDGPTPSGIANPSPSGPVGAIEGVVGYPADTTPPMMVYAVATDSSRFYYVEKVAYGWPRTALDSEWRSYRLLGVAPGDYFVLTIPRDSALWKPWQPASSVRAPGSVRFGAGYTRAVQCGLTVECRDHALVSVHVSANATVSGIDPGDWYVGDPNFYPPVPGPMPWAISYVPGGQQSFANPTAAVERLLQSQAEVVQPGSACHTNVACGWITGEIHGQSAAYVTNKLGTNGLFRSCISYLTQDGAGWRIIDSNCTRLDSAFPALEATGVLAFSPRFELQPTCVNFHASPDLTSKVTACKTIGTTVTIDDGPVFTQQSSPDPKDVTLNYWWHVAGEGWVVHHYLVWSA